MFGHPSAKVPVRYVDFADMFQKSRLPTGVEALECSIVPHPRFWEVSAHVARLHARCKAQVAPRALLLLGQSGAGKSTLLDCYRAEFPHVTFESVKADPGRAVGLSQAQVKGLRHADLKRVVYIEINKQVTQRSLSADLLGAFGLQAPRDWTANDVIERLAALVVEMGTELILIDEAHYVVRERNEEFTSDMAEFLKSLLNKVNAQIVLAGLPKLRDLRGHRQFWRRLEPDANLVPYDWQTLHGRVEFMTILAKFEELLGLPEASNLIDHEIAKRLYVATGGEIGILSKYLSQALTLALRSEHRRVGIELLAEVHESFRQIDERVDSRHVVIDFDAVISDDDQSKMLHSLLKEHNPFVCSAKQLREIYERTIVGQQRSARSREGGRRTGSRATGHGPITPLTS